MIQHTTAPAGETLWQTVTGHPLFASILGVVVLAAAAWLADRLAKRILLQVLGRLVARSRSKWDDSLLEHNVFGRLAHLVPALIVFYGLAFVPGLPAKLVSSTQQIAGAVALVLGALVITALIDAVSDIAQGSKLAQGRPVGAFFQVVNIVVYVVTTILVLAALMGESPLVLLSGIGAATAVLLLVFRDTLLSFISSLQITWYDMVRVGDWIEVPEYGADGDVMKVDLLTISVRNWDNTVTTVPTYRLTQGSFKNWRFMTHSGGRRIKRSLLIDMESIHFLADEEVERFQNYDLLADYVATKRRELAEYNRSHVRTPEVISNVRRLTNVGTFRAYIIAYLRQRPDIHHSGFTLMVRQLSPTTHGLPLEIYVFTNTTDWVAYEDIQSNIFDHLLAIAPEFDLRVFQTPSGQDIRSLSGSVIDH